MGRNTVEEPKSKRCAVNWFNRQENQQERRQKLSLHTSCIEGTSYNCYLHSLSNGIFYFEMFEIIQLRNFEVRYADGF